jgi:tRNA(Ile)-lysidine synthase
VNLGGFLQQHSEQLESADRVFVGFSGGLDSTILLYSAVHLLGAEKVCALHVNHSLQPEADAWELHCSNESKQLGVEFRVAKLSIANKGQGLESEARTQRYQFFRMQLSAKDFLLLGHHIDDQAETLLYRLFRGAGLRGLSAIPEQRAEGLGKLIRPLLNKTREELYSSAKEAKLDWIEDLSNSDISYDRNYIRAKILPTIQQRWPAANKTLARAASNMSSIAALLDEYAVELQSRCDWQPARWGWSLDASKFIDLSPAAQAHLLAVAFNQLDLQGFDSAYLEKVHKLLQSREDSSPELKIENSELRRFGGRLYLMRAIEEFSSQNKEFYWGGSGPLMLSGCGEISALQEYRGDELKVSFRQGGERCKPIDRDKSQSLKKLMQEYALEPWLRERVPLIWRDDQIIAVADLFSCSKEISAPKFAWDLEVKA